MASSTKTEALYQKNGSVHTHTTTILSTQPLSDLPPETQSLFKPDTENQYVITTSKTIFHAQGGGQPADTGTIRPANASSPIFTVSAVRRSESAILHLGTFNPSDSTFPPNTPVIQEIDKEKRRLNSRLHTAGHVLGLAIRSLSKEGVLPDDLKEVKASHYPGAAFVEFQGLISGDKKAAIQAKVDELMQQNLEIKIHFWSKEEAKERCTVVLECVKGEEGRVRVVEVGEIGSYPCGGTHVMSMKELGRVVVRNIKRQKGISKVSYEVQDS
ncbi:alanyl-tRNA synthetase-like protein [Zopfia rhizophila CBS 207.26]|uniref:Alanyl-tRNA synthetase-like protein n=1 Tax=Zopfia rhizophila CBS 207.26 TaxID=1314779 RepID=A0A6A6DZJ3_9PEZI|nr:alanyl-tRNA synthetase-like protein [Zopfia rhizophila CBS 207.26]